MVEPQKSLDRSDCGPVKWTGQTHKSRSQPRRLKYFYIVMMKPVLGYGPKLDDCPSEMMDIHHTVPQYFKNKT